jgi:hypothetical protein
MKYDYAIKIVELFGEENFRFCLPEELIPITRFLNVDLATENVANFYINERLKQCKTSKKLKKNAKNKALIAD